MLRFPEVGYVLCPLMCSTGSPRASPSVFTVGPGDISEYGTRISTPAQSSAIRMRVEASIVAVRRGMERQYGNGLSVHRRGRSVRGGGTWPVRAGRAAPGVPLATPTGRRG